MGSMLGLCYLAFFLTASAVASKKGEGATRKYGSNLMIGYDPSTADCKAYLLEMAGDIVTAYKSLKKSARASSDDGFIERMANRFNELETFADGPSYKLSDAPLFPLEKSPFAERLIQGSLSFLRTIDDGLDSGPFALLDYTDITAETAHEIAAPIIHQGAIANYLSESDDPSSVNVIETQRRASLLNEEHIMFEASTKQRSSEVPTERMFLVQWLKYVEIEIIKVRDVNEVAHFSAAAEGNPCVAFAETDRDYPKSLVAVRRKLEEFQTKAAGLEKQDTTAQGTTAQGTTAQDTTAQDTTAQDTTTQDTTTQDTTAQDTTEQSTTAQDTTTQDTTGTPVPTDAVTTAAGTISIGPEDTAPGKDSYVAAIWGNPITPNDNKWSEQWNMLQLETPAGWALRTERGPLFGAVKNVTVAVVDTGCDIGSIDLKNMLWRNTGEICDNGIDDDDNGYVDDCYGFNFLDNNTALVDTGEIHGTPVSGAILADTNNGWGLASVCPFCELMCLRVGNNTMNGAAMNEAINYSIGMGALIINISTSGVESDAQKKAVQAMGPYDMNLVVSAGNDGCDLTNNKTCVENYGYPGMYDFDWIIMAGSSEKNGTYSDYSNYGSTTVNLLAPAGSILLSTNDTFTAMTGTSFASPVVAGAAGMVRGTFPFISANETVKAITDSCRQGAAFKGRAICPGVLNVPAAISRAGQMMAEKINGSSF